MNEQKYEVNHFQKKKFKFLKTFLLHKFKSLLITEYYIYIFFMHTYGTKIRVLEFFVVFNCFKITFQNT